jgi:lipopolysaccharide export system permease protein
MMGDNNAMYHIDFFDGTTNTMTNVIVLGFDNGIQLKTRVDAKQAHYENGQWIFSNGFFRIFDDTGAELSCQSFDQMNFSLAEKPGDFLKEDVEPWELNILQLYSHIQRLKQSGTDDHKEWVQFHKKIAFPFACITLALLGVPWGWSLGKYSGVASSFGICMIVAFSYIGGMQIFETLGTSGTLPPLASMWIANLIFGAGGIWMLLRKNR